MNKNITEIVCDNKLTYREVKVGRTLYRVTSIFKGEVELGRVLEDLAVKKALQAASLFHGV